MAALPYVPMRPQTEPVSESRMREILERNAKGVCNLPLSEPEPPPKPYVPVEWEAPVWTSEHHATGYILSRCGRWSVSKVRTGESTFYEAWKRATVAMPPQLLDIKNSPDEAKAVCEARANA